MNRAVTLEQLARLCRTGSDVTRTLDVESSGSAPLDAVLPGGGWQVGSLVELLPSAVGIGELQLLMPTLARISHSERHIALVAPPLIPFPAAWSQQGVRLEHLLVIQADKPGDVLWACEQTLRCKSFGAVISWPVVIKDREIRRLQLAAEAGRSIGFMYRPVHAAFDASPAATRLRLHATQDGLLNVEVLKCRGGRSGMTVSCPRRRAVVGNEVTASTTPAPAEISNTDVAAACS